VEGSRITLALVFDLQERGGVADQDFIHPAVIMATKADPHGQHFLGRHQSGAGE
jgi:hypothetical protein